MPGKFAPMLVGHFEFVAFLCCFWGLEESNVFFSFRIRKQHQKQQKNTGPRVFLEGFLSVLLVGVGKNMFVFLMLKITED